MEVVLVEEVRRALLEGKIELLYTTNVVSTFNVLTQAAALGVRRAVVASSINVYGVPLNRDAPAPAYFPLDEQVPADIADWYSLSKSADEQTARMVWRRWGTDALSLRFPHVNTAQELVARSLRHADDPAAGLCEAWVYLNVRDAARAIELALTAPVTGAHAGFLAAATTIVPHATEALLDRYASAAPRRRRFSGREVPMDLTAVRTLLGYTAEHKLGLPPLELG
jgi:nucleoside-diphosphate-sugar epimerase